MTAREVVGVFVMHQKQRFEVCQMVVFAKYSPYLFPVGLLTIIPLMLLKFSEFVNQCPINDKPLVPVSPWRFVFMRTNTFNEEACHFEVRISKQSRDIVFSSHYLCQERTIAVSYHYIRPFLVA